MSNQKHISESTWIATPEQQQLINIRVEYLKTFEKQIPGVIVVHNLKEFSSSVYVRTRA